MIRSLFLCSLVLVFASMAALSEAEAGLTINFDPNSNELFFSGEDSGTPDVETSTFFIPSPFPNAQPGEGTTVITNNFTIPFGSDAVANSFPISSTTSALFGNGVGLNAFFNVVPGSGSGISLLINPVSDSGDSLNITGNEDVRLDISKFGADTLAFLASQDGTTVSRSTPPSGTVGGTGFEELHFNVVAAVPEPAAATLLALTGLTLSCRRRRRS